MSPSNSIYGWLLCLCHDPCGGEPLVIYTRKQKMTQEYRRRAYCPHLQTHFLRAVLNSLAQHCEGGCGSSSASPCTPCPTVLPSTWQPSPNPSHLRSSQTEKESRTMVGHTKFLAEFLPGFWEHKTTQISTAPLTCAAMQQGEDNKTRALCVRPFGGPHLRVGGGESPVEKAKEWQWGEGSEGKTGRRGTGPGGGSWEGSRVKWGKQQLPFRCVGSRIRKLRVGVQSKQGVMPITWERLLEAGPLFLLGEGWPFRSRVRLFQIPFCLNGQVNNTASYPLSLTRSRPSRTLWVYKHVTFSSY